MVSEFIFAQTDTVFYKIDLSERNRNVFKISLFLTPEYTGVMDFKSKITFAIPRNWKFVSGLHRVGNTLYAKNMDNLFDSPVLMGDSLIIKTFLVKSRLHYVAGMPAAIPSQPVFIEDLRKMVESATELMGSIPYDHYSFMSIGEGNGGIEQTNSTAFALTADAYSGYEAQQRTLNFLTHEYFHHFNVKRMRPIELGPFN